MTFDRDRGAGRAARRRRRPRPPLRARLHRREGEAGEPPPSCGTRPARAASRGQPPRRVRRRRRRHHRAGDRLRGAERGRLRAADDGGVPGDRGTIITRFGTEEQRKRLAARARRRLAKIMLRHHRAGRRLQLPPARHDGPPRRRRLAAQRPQVLHLRRRRRRPSSSSPGTEDAADAARLKPALFVVPTDAPGSTALQARHGDRVAGQAVPALPGRRPAARRRADRRRGTPGCRRCSPG